MPNFLLPRGIAVTEPAEQQRALVAHVPEATLRSFGGGRLLLSVSAYEDFIFRLPHFG